MGEYLEEQNQLIIEKINKKADKEKIIEIKHFLGIPFIWVKRSEYTKSYYLFNKIPLWRIEAFGGF